MAILRNNPDILEETVPDDMVTLGEHYFISGFRSQAKQLVESVAGNFSSLSKSGKLRMLALDSALSDNIKKNISTVQTILRVREDRARSILHRAVKKLKSASNKVSG